LSAVLVSYAKKVAQAAIVVKGFYPLECGTGELPYCDRCRHCGTLVSIRLSAVLVSYSKILKVETVGNKVSIRLSAVLVSYLSPRLRKEATAGVSIRLSAVLVSYMNATTLSYLSKGFYPLECGTGELRLLS